jgi:transposase
MFRDPVVEELFDVLITADRTRNIPSSNIRWTNKPPRRARTFAENVADPGIYKYLS